MVSSVRGLHSREGLVKAEWHASTLAEVSSKAHHDLSGDEPPPPVGSIGQKRLT